MPLQNQKVKKKVEQEVSAQMSVKIHFFEYMLYFVL